MPEALADWRPAAADAQSSLRSLAADDGTEQIRQALTDVGATLADTKDTVQQARRSIEPVRQGRGDLSALLMDERLYDDLQETVVHLKKNPWKFFWKE